MKKVVGTSLLILSLGVGFSNAYAETPPQQAQQQRSEKNWQDALATQLELAKTKVLLLQAYSEVWLDKNKDAALLSVNKAGISLDNAWKSADQTTRIRIAKLQKQVDSSKNSLQKKQEGAEAQLGLMVNHSELVLSSALAQAQMKSSALKSEAASRYALVQAHAEVLKAQVALEIEQSPDSAAKALERAEVYLIQVKESASNLKAKQLETLHKEVKNAQLLVRNNSLKATSQVRQLVKSTEVQMGVYEQRFLETDEVQQLRKHYVQLEAQAALLKAQLAIKADATGQQSIAYLNESKRWYESLKVEAINRGEKGLVNMSGQIDNAKQAVKNKDQEVRAKLSKLLDDAAEFIKSDK